jgi:hypothetical protein
MTRNEKIGAALLVLSCLLYAAILAVPLLGGSVGEKAAITGGLALTGEGAFWLGALVAGREVMRRYRSRLSPRTWFRRGASRSRQGDRAA